MVNRITGVALAALIVFAPGVSSAQGGDAANPTFHTRGLTQAHADELRDSILDAARRVNSASSVEERTRWQEELCKRLIQSEDYVNALHVAHAVYMSEGANAERRAVHHFLVARIYRMMMDSAPDTTAMEDARQLALKTAQEVQRKRYPASWGIDAAAGQLQRELSSRDTIASAEFAASKRAQGGVDQGQAEVSKAQTAAMEAAIFGGATRIPSGYTPVPEPASGAQGAASRRRVISGGGPASDIDSRSAQTPSVSSDVVDLTKDGPTRAEILARLRESRDDRRMSASVPGGVASPGMNSNRGAEMAARIASQSGNMDQFPDFGASGGRSMGAPTFQNGGAIRGGSGTGYGDRPNLTSEETSLLAPQRLTNSNSSNSSGAAGALAARSAMDPRMASSGYVPGGVNRSYQIRPNASGSASGQSARLSNRSGSGAPTVTQGIASRSQASQRSAGGYSSRSSNSDMIRFSWTDARRGPGAAQEATSGRLNGPVIIDQRSGRVQQ